MDVMDIIGTIFKKVLPQLASTAVLVVAADWALQAVSGAPVLMWIIRIAITVAIVLYLTIKVWDAYLQMIDQHQLRQRQIEQLGPSWIDPARIVEAGPPRPLLGSYSFQQVSPSPKIHNPRMFFTTVCIIALIIACVLGAMFAYPNITNLIAARSDAGIVPDASAIAANPYPSYFHGGGSLVIYDSLFQSSKSLWPTSPQCQFIAHAYHVSTSHTNNLHTCVGQTKPFKNFTYEVEMTILKGDCGGLLFREEQSSGNKYYLLRVCQDQTYTLLKYMDNVNVHAQHFRLPSNNNSAIMPGLGRKNRIAVITKDNAMYLYIHDHQVAEIDDHNGYAVGYVGLVAYSYKNSTTTEVAYQNLKIWSDTTS